jgi:hypothetical protein
LMVYFGTAKPKRTLDKSGHMHIYIPPGRRNQILFPASFTLWAAGFARVFYRSAVRQVRAPAGGAMLRAPSAISPSPLTATLWIEHPLHHPALNVPAAATPEPLSNRDAAD